MRGEGRCDCLCHTVEAVYHLVGSCCCAHGVPYEEPCEDCPRPGSDRVY